MHLLMTRTTIGRAMRAVSENPALAGVVGIDVDSVIRATWLIGGALACAAGVMVGITVQIRPFMGFDLLLPLFAAAILGGIGSVPGAVLGGLIVGLAEAAGGAAGRRRVPRRGRLPAPDRRAARPADRTLRGARMMLDLLGYGAFFLATALSYGIICLGLNLQWGQTGLFNVGVAGFVAIGAYTSALLTTPETADRFGGFDLPIAVGWARRDGRRAGLAWLIGALTLRLRADYLAITTFGVAVSIQLVALNAAGADRRPVRHRLHPAPLRVGCRRTRCSSTSPISRWSLAVVIVLYVALERLVRSPWGRVLRAIREDETAALSLGKNARAYRLQAFVLGGAIMGLAGAMQGHFIGFIAPDNYLSALTFQVWAMLIVGGAGNNRGALLGRDRRLGIVERFRRAHRRRCSRPTSRRAPPRCRSS